MCDEIQQTARSYSISGKLLAPSSAYSTTVARAVLAYPTYDATTKLSTFAPSNTPVVLVPSVNERNEDFQEKIRGMSMNGRFTRSEIYKGSGNLHRDLKKGEATALGIRVGMLVGTGKTNGFCLAARYRWMGLVTDERNHVNSDQDRIK